MSPTIDDEHFSGAWSNGLGPGRELDALVAETVMGWKRGNTDGTWIAPGWDVPAFWSLPQYSTSFKLAFEIRDEIAKMLFSRRMAFTNELQRLISADVKGLSFAVLLNHSEIIMRVQPHHICLAALKAVGVEIPQK